MGQLVSYGLKLTRVLRIVLRARMLRARMLRARMLRPRLLCVVCTPCRVLAGYFRERSATYLP